jgi:hypothetical protein
MTVPFGYEIEFRGLPLVRIKKGKRIKKDKKRGS